ncbi:endonuclease [Bacillus subtilis subsp. subtilis]|uniref:Putative GIY-YIG endonuclease n=1 Tax=Bacillus sp. BSG40 TaxID=157931 RepID=Q93L78_9BACI|nr:endonuclease [Bacillus subtilis subsp. subtilis]CAC51107.1 putative GIY-YIG endonuclease [Bacillus sp. BSG40]
MKAVYKIRNIKNGKFYIGSSANFRKRKTEHLRLLKSGSHHNKPLQEDFNTYGENNFLFEVLYHSDYINRFDLYKKEQEFLSNSEKEQLYNLYDNAFGMSYRGEKNPMFGKTHSEAVRRNSSKINSGKNNYWYDKPEHMEKMRSKITKRFDGRKHTEETKRKMSLSRKGRKKTKETCLKLSLNNGNRVGIIVDGVYYHSMSEAGRRLNISRNTINSRVNNSKFKNYFRCSEGVETNCRPEISAG